MSCERSALRRVANHERAPGLEASNGLAATQETCGLSYLDRLPEGRWGAEPYMPLQQLSPSSSLMKMHRHRASSPRPLSLGMWGEVALFSLVISACGASSSSSEMHPGSAGGAAGSTGTGGSAGSTGGTTTCPLGQGNESDCFATCNTMFRMGASDAAGPFLQNCVCPAGLPCAAACANDYCAGQTPAANSPCASCVIGLIMSPSASCRSAVDTAISASVDAQQWIACRQACKPGPGVCIPDACLSLFGVNQGCTAPSCTSQTCPSQTSQCLPAGSNNLCFSAAQTACDCSSATAFVSTKDTSVSF